MTITISSVCGCSMTTTSPTLPARTLRQIQTTWNKRVVPSSWRQAQNNSFSKAWYLHVYGIGIACLILAIVAGYTIYYTVKLNKLKSREYFLALNGLLLAFGGARSAYLLIDGYNANGLFPETVDLILMETGFPCLTAAFYVLLAALFRVTLPMRKIETKVFTVKWLVGIISAILGSSMAVSILVGVFDKSKLLLLVTEVVFIVVNVAFCAGFFVIFVRLNCRGADDGEKSASHRFSTSTTSTTRTAGSKRLSSVSETVSHREAAKNVTPIPSPMLTVPLTPISQPRTSSNASSDVKMMPSKSSSDQGRSSSQYGSPRRGGSATSTKGLRSTTTILSVVTASFFLLNAIAHSIDIASKFAHTDDDDDNKPDAWLWWAHATTLRLIELSMAYTILYIASGPARSGTRRRSCRHQHVPRHWHFRRGIFRSGKTVEVSSSDPSSAMGQFT